jgi:hypothetical protein
MKVRKLRAKSVRRVATKTYKSKSGIKVKRIIFKAQKKKN